MEDPGIKVSGPIWVKGGIKIISSDNKTYEIRNRVTLCRCGQSKNKPFCDGTHAAIRYEDGLSQVAKRPNEDFWFYIINWSEKIDCGNSILDRRCAIYLYLLVQILWEKDFFVLRGKIIVTILNN